MPPPRRLVLAGLLLLVLIASAGPGEDARTPEVVGPVDRGQTSVAPRRREAAPEIDLSKLTRTKSRQASRDLFAPRTFYTPPPPPPAPVAMAAPPPPPPPAPPPPSAPPLPFTYMGRVIDDPGQPVFFLVKGDKLYNVKVGEVIEETYRVDSVAGPHLRLIYLPLDIAQLLPIGDS